MAAGAPVLTSNISSLPEVAGDAAILVDPRSVAAIREGLRRGLEDRPRGGRERARTFSWARYAQQIVQACESARR